MTGDGTVTAPFIPENWGDFVTAAGTAGAYVKLAADIDLNDYAPEGVDQTDLRCEMLDGAGFSLRNLHYHDTKNLFYQSRSGVTVKDLKFENFYISSGGVFLSAYSTYRTSFVGCSFSGELISGSLTGTYHRFNRCSFNLSGTNYRAFYEGKTGYNPILTNCNIGLNGTLTAFRAALSNSLLSGSFSGSGTLNLAKNTYTQATETSVINAGISGFNAINDTGAATTLLNTDLCAVPLTAGNLLRVTSEQLKDAGYLRSIGFPIGVD